VAAPVVWLSLPTTSGTVSFGWQVRTRRMPQPLAVSGAMSDTR